MTISNNHIADSVVERIQAIKQQFIDNAPASKVVRAEIVRDEFGKMIAMVRHLKDGTEERIEMGAPPDAPPEGLVQISEGQDGQLPGLDESGLDVGTILGGGNSLDAALKS